MIDAAPDASFFEAASPGVPAYHGFIPPLTRVDDRLPLVLCIHGISRDAREQVDLLRPEANSRGYALLAPLFDEVLFADYQRLGRRGRGPRADLALIETIKRFEQVVGRRCGPVFIMGYSGGGQFAHRFTMAHPELIAAAVVSSSGWYLMPDSRTVYPRGIRVDGDLVGVRFDPDTFLRVPMLVTVGTKDTGRNESIRTTPRLDASQGKNRLERARTWSRAMAEAAIQRGLAVQVDTVELPGVGHSFRDCVEKGMDRIGFDLFDSIIRERAC